MSLAKLEIRGSKNDPSGNVQAGGDKVFKCLINPEKLVHTKGLKWNSNNSANTNGRDTKQFQGYEPENLKFDIVLDGTGVTEGSGRTTVATQMKKLHEACYDYESSIHKPRYCIVNWGGKYGFVGHLKSMNVEYNLFATNGDPLRAKVSLTFVEHVNRNNQQRRFNNQSPDMTHVKTVRESDALTLMCSDTYHHMKYYVQVAELNNLTNFRSLGIGAQLEFPPLVNR